jgi:FkbM family methyltransferase
MLPRRSAAEVVGNLCRRARNIGSFAVQRYVLRRRYVERSINGYRLLLDGDDPGISRQLIHLGKREAEQKYIVEHMLKPGMSVLDLGANVGYYTVMMARIVGTGGRVCAVEPHPGNFKLLEANVARNGIADRTDLRQIAIGRERGLRPLLLTEHSNWHSFVNPVVDPKLAWQAKYRRRIVGAIEVETHTLADYLEHEPPIDLLRMDLEGYEVEILRSIEEQGARWAGRLHVLFETHPEFYDPRHNDIRPVLEALCERHGYRIRHLVSDFHFGSREEADMEPGRAVFQRYGYGDGHIVALFRNRAIYAGIKTSDAIELIATREQVNAALLAPAVREVRL